MQCDRFEELLFEKLEGDLDRETTVLLDAHAAGCQRCHDLAALLAAEASTVADDFTASILALTTARAPIERALRQLDLDLPALASMVPDDDFVADVMSLTIEADRGRLHRRLATFWNGLVARPRFALEGAYLGAMAGFLLVGTPWSPLAGVPEQVIGELRNRETIVRATVTEGAARIGEISTVTWSRAGDLINHGVIGRDAAIAPGATHANESEVHLPAEALAAVPWTAVAAEWLDAAWVGAIVPSARWLVSPWLGHNDSRAEAEQRNAQQPETDDDNDDRNHSA
jgi:hypothetical protein